MKAILNNEILNWEELHLSPLNRGFRYGDGFFETIAIIKGIPRFLERHLNRLKKGAEILKLDVRGILDNDAILKNIHDIQTKNNLLGDAKLRLTIWRNSDGLYTPDDDKTHYLLTIESFDFSKNSFIKNVGISTKTINYLSPVSRFKTLSAIKYVIAGIEKKEKKLDEIILLDFQGHVSETMSSNLFWKIKNTYCTPPLSTGCIEGIMRNWLLHKLKQKGFLVEEKLVKTEEFLHSDSIFTTNATGLSHIQKIGRNIYEMDLASQ
jgi:4-amino-4-deoxychorismate lyase